MRSIRFSLVVYFFTLLVIGLGGVSALTYQTTAVTLAEKEASASMLALGEFEKQSENHRQEFDHHLLLKAREFVRRHSKPGRIDSLNSLGVMGSALLPYGYLNIGVQLRLGTWPLWWMTPASLRSLEARTVDSILSGMNESFDED